MSKILITGGAGFIGSNLVRYMVRRGHQILNVDCLTYAGNLRSLADVENDPNYRFARVDIVDAESIRQTLVDFAPDAVMHLAAESHVDRSIDGPRPFVDTNVCGTLNLLQAALAHWRTLDGPRADRFRFLHVSTDEVFGSLGPEGLFNERSRYDPHSPYAASKAASDHLARAWKDTYGLPVVVTHCSNNYGPYQFPEKLVPLVILKCLRGEPIPVFGNGENVRDWLYVEDHCEALAAVLAGGRPGETFNIGGNNQLRNIDLVRTLCGIMDDLRPSDDGSPYETLIRFVADRPGHDLRYAVDNTLIRERLGWRPKQDPDSGFRETVRWYLENADWWQAILSGTYRLERLGKPERLARAATPG
jgi:dTDP-glucose 4,6-dehydratase